MKYQSLLALFTFCLAIGIAEPSHSLDNKKTSFSQHNTFRLITN